MSSTDQHEKELIEQARAASRRPADTPIDDGPEAGPMAETIDGAKYLGDLARSGLLTDDEFESFATVVAEKVKRGNAKLIAAELVRQELVTPWQARMLLNGRVAFHVDRFVLEDFLGRGGMGAVFRARQEGLGRTVALKVMANHLVRSDEAVKRFHREIRAVAAFNHPHLVHAIDAGSIASSHYLVMEYLDGESLSSMLKRVPQLDISVACGYAMQAALGLTHIHSKGLVHRDIKPSNLIITRDTAGVPCVKILDLGLARLLDRADDSSDEVTTTDQILGTPDYIAPEQARHTRSADIRSDIYSLGCTLFRMLTGRIPFVGENAMEKLTARLIEDPPTVRELRPNIPATLDQTVARMMARSPDERFQSPDEVVAALSLFAGNAEALGDTVIMKSAVFADADGDDEPHTDRQQEPPENLVVGFLRQLETDTTTNLRAGVSTLNEHAGNLAAAEREARSKPDALASADSASGDSAKTYADRLAEKRRADKRRMLLIAGGLAGVAMIVMAFAFVRYLGRATLILEWPEEMRENARLTVDESEYPVPPSGPVEISRRAGTHIIRADREGYLTIETTVTLERGESRTIPLQWKPTPATRRTAEWRALKKTVDRISATEKPGAELEAAANNARTSLVRFADGWKGTEEAAQARELRRRIPWPADFLRAGDLSPRDHAAAYLGLPQENLATIVAVYGESRLNQWASINTVAYSPNGKSFATGSVSERDPSVYVWDALSGVLKHRCTAPGFRGPGRIRISPDSRWLAVAENKTAAFHVFDTLTGKLKWTLPTAGAVSAHQFSRDGKLIYASPSGDDHVRVWETETGNEVPHFHKSPGTINAMALSPDGKHLASGNRHGVVHLWDFATGKSIATLDYRDTTQGRSLTAAVGISAGGHFRLRRPAGRYVSDLKFSPDGRFLAVRDASARDVLVWDVEKRSLGFVSDRLISGEVFYDYDFSPDSRLLAAASSSGRLRLWRTDGWKALLTVPGDPTKKLDQTLTSKIQGVRFSPDGAHISRWTQDGQILLLNLKTGKDRNLSKERLLSGYVHAFSPDSSKLLTGRLSGEICLTDIATGNRVIKTGPGITAVTSGPLGRWLAVADESKMLTIHDWPSRKIVWQYQLPHLAKALVVHPQKRWIAVAMNHARSVVLDVERKAVVRQTDIADDVGFTPDGSKLLVCGSEGSVRLVGLNDDSPAVPLFKATAGSRLVAHPDGQSFLHVDRLAKTTRRGLATGELINQIGPDVIGPYDYAIRPDGKQITMARGKTGVEIYDVETGKRTDRLDDIARAVAYSPDGEMLAIAKEDGFVRIVHARHLAFLKRFRVAPQDARIERIRFTADARHLVTRNENGTVYVVRIGTWRKKDSGR